MHVQRLWQGSLLFGIALFILLAGLYYVFFYEWYTTIVIPFYDYYWVTPFQGLLLIPLLFFLIMCVFYSIGSRFLSRRGASFSFFLTMLLFWGIIGYGQMKTLAYNLGICH
ncbi:hypothetical protein EV213_106210 [Aureibacillus halotolerans]|uniref:Uncharacterized protein n=1 Tax=Aureibacillus halotolerans TaxID=1508390 RepID=A0A4R6U3A5_9BACI|nr:hypothetical protein EV213_106210 [Aureibacillus halotolerans]